jgi:two-component system NtrC family sensor kinase
MKRVFTFILLLTLSGITGSAQTPQGIDTLENQLRFSRNDTERIDIEVRLCYLYHLGNGDSSILYGNQAVELARKIHYPEGEISALSFMALSMEQLGNYPRTLQLGFRALQVAHETGLAGYSGPALSAIGTVYMALGDYRKAMSYYQEEESLSLNQKNVVRQVFSYFSNLNLAYSYWNLGNSYKALHILDSAAYFEQQAVLVFQKEGWEEPLVYQALGDIDWESGKAAGTLSLFRKALQIALTNNEQRAIPIIYNRIATYYKNMNLPDSAIYYAQKGLAESQFISQKKSILESASLLAALYEPTDIREALRYLKIVDRYKDSLFGEQNIQAIQALEVQENERKREIAEAQAADQIRLKQYALFAGLGILLLVAAILWYNNRQKIKANKILEGTLKNLKSTQAQLVQSEKMASLGELTAGIAHEIQNPLNFVNNFSEVNKELIDEASQANDAGNPIEIKELLTTLKGNEEKIIHHGKRADAIVKGMLQHSRSSTGKKEPTNINALADEYLILSYHGLRAKDKSFNATIKTDFDNLIVSINIIPQDIGRVLLNLYNNAFYAVIEKMKQQPESYEPTVSVSTKKMGHRVLISVKDNGSGIPQKIIDKIFQPFFTTKPTDQGTGLGLSLSYDIVKAHGGEIKVDTKEGEGSEFIIFLPLLT